MEFDLQVASCYESTSIISFKCLYFIIKRVTGSLFLVDLSLVMTSTPSDTSPFRSPTATMNETSDGRLNVTSDLMNMTTSGNSSTGGIDIFLDSSTTPADNATTAEPHLFDGLGEQFTNSPTFYIM